ncbi:MAG: DUF2892 domain-containing protein [Spirochaetales bacterium]|nr:MAG: DUF2892 domain-containing protein [Spirochaetales bacterium]
MIKNMGVTDRLVRTAFAIMIAALYFTGVIRGTVAIVLGIVALVLVATSLIGTCPLYIPFKLDSNKKKS